MFIWTGVQCYHGLLHGQSTTVEVSNCCCPVPFVENEEMAFFLRKIKFVVRKGKSFHSS